MDPLSLLNQAAKGKPYTSFENLPRGDYRVRSFSLVETKFGTVMRVDLADKYLLLPKRFADDQTEESINLLNSSPKLMEYRGKDATNRNL